MPCLALPHNVRRQMQVEIVHLAIRLRAPWTSLALTNAGVHHLGSLTVLPGNVRVLGSFVFRDVPGLAWTEVPRPLVERGCDPLVLQAGVAVLRSGHVIWVGAGCLGR